MFELYCQEQAAYLLWEEPRSASLFWINSVTGSFDLVYQAAERQDCLNQLRYLLDTQAPQAVGQFEHIAGFVPSRIHPILIACNATQVGVLFNQPVLQPANFRFYALRALRIAREFPDSLDFTSDLPVTNCLIGGHEKPMAPSSQIDVDVQETEVMENVRQFFVDAAPNLYFESAGKVHLSSSSLNEVNSNFIVNQTLSVPLSNSGIPCAKLVFGDFTQIFCFEGLVLSIITRQNQLHVGTRFNARGLNGLAGAANEFEHQLIYDIGSPNPKVQARHGSQTLYLSQHPSAQNEFFSLTILRGSAPLHWKSDAGLLRNDFLLEENPQKLSGVYWRRTLQPYKEGVILNLLRAPESGVDQGKADETLICQEYENSAKAAARELSEEMGKQLKYFNFQWHEEHHKAKVSVKEWLKNQGLLQSSKPGKTQSGINITRCGLEGSGAGSKRLAALRQDPTYLSQMLTVVQLLQRLDGEGMDVAAGVWSIDGDARITQPQEKLLRINCADSLDRTNLVLFHVTQVINALIVGFILTVLQDQKEGAESLMQREKLLQYQQTILKQFAPLKDTPETRVMYLTILEHLLFAENQTSVYADLALTFSKLANIISMTYAGTTAAHQEIMALFCDIETSSSSMVAIKRRMQAVTKKETQKHEALNSLGIEKFSKILTIRPFQCQMDSSPVQLEAALSGSALQMLFQIPFLQTTSEDIRPQQLQYALLRYFALTPGCAAERLRQASARFSKSLEKMEAQNYLVKFFASLLLLHKQQLNANTDLDYFARAEMASLTMDQTGARISGTPGSLGDASFKLGNAGIDVFPGKLLGRTNLLTKAFHHPNKMLESVRWQMQLEFCPFEMLDRLSLIQTELQYCQAQQAFEPMDGQSAKTAVLVMQYEFVAPVSLLDVVLQIPPQQIGCCTNQLVLIGHDENGLAFCLGKMNIPSSLQQEQQCQYSLPETPAQVTDSLLQSILTLSSLYDQRAIPCIAQYPRLLKLEAVFYVSGVGCFPRFHLLGVQREYAPRRRQQEPEQLNRFNKTLVQTFSSSIAERLQRNQSLTQLTFPLLAYGSIFRHGQRDVDQIVDFMHLQAFECVRSEFGEQLMFCAFALQNRVPLYYLQSCLMLLNINPARIRQVLCPRLLPMESVAAAKGFPLRPNEENTALPFSSAALQNSQFCQAVQSDKTDLCNFCARRDVLVTCAICRQACCKLCVAERLQSVIGALDFSRCFLLCKKCAQEEQERQDLLGKYLKLNIAEAQWVEGGSGREGKREVQIPWTRVEGNSLEIRSDGISFLRFRVSRKISLERVEGGRVVSSISGRFSTQISIAVEQDRKSIALHFSRMPLLGKEFLLEEIEPTAQISPPLNFRALATQIKQPVLQEIQPWDLCVTEEIPTHQQLFDYVFKDRVQIRRIQINNVSPRPTRIALVYLTHHEDDEYIRERKKPAKTIKAKQNSTCSKLTFEQIHLPQNLVGGRFIAFDFGGEFLSNRVQIQLDFEENIGQTDLGLTLLQ